VLLERYENIFMANIAAMNSTEVKAIRKSK